MILTPPSTTYDSCSQRLARIPVADSPVVGGSEKTTPASVRVLRRRIDSLDDAAFTPRTEILARG